MNTTFWVFLYISMYQRGDRRANFKWLGGGQIWPAGCLLRTPGVGYRVPCEMLGMVWSNGSQTLDCDPFEDQGFSKKRIKLGRMNI